MKKNIKLVILLILAIVVIYYIAKKEVVAPVVMDNSTDISYTDLTEKENIESYLRENISTLSPIKAVLGGTWYVVSTTIDLEKKSGIVTYEDGHIQGKKNFSYAVNEKREIVNMTIN